MPVQVEFLKTVLAIVSVTALAAVFVFVGFIGLWSKNLPAKTFFFFSPNPFFGIVGRSVSTLYYFKNLLALYVLKVLLIQWVTSQ